MSNGTKPIFTKSRFYGEDEKDRKVAQSVSIHVMRELLKLLHPYCPFITEMYNLFKLQMADEVEHFVQQLVCQIEK